MSRVWAPTWDDGIRWWSRRTVEPTAMPLELAEVRDLVLRVANGSVEDDHIERLLRAATAAAEHDTDRALMPQTWTLTLDKFPPNSGRIVLPRPPLIGVTSFEYVDGDGVTQTLAGSPAEYQVKASGLWSRAEVRPLEGATWPTTAVVAEAVTITLECGYALDESVSPPSVTVPDDILVGIELMVGELYKQRTLSVHAVHNTPSVLLLSHFWKPVP